MGCRFGKGVICANKVIEKERWVKTKRKASNDQSSKDVMRKGEDSHTGHQLNIKVVEY